MLRERKERLEQTIEDGTLRRVLLDENDVQAAIDDLDEALVVLHRASEAKSAAPAARPKRSRTTRASNVDDDPENSKVWPHAADAAPAPPAAERPKRGRPRSEPAPPPSLPTAELAPEMFDASANGVDRARAQRGEA